MRISDWSSDVCSSDLPRAGEGRGGRVAMPSQQSTTPSPTPPVGGSGDRSVTLAAVIGAHGVTGEVRLKLFTDDLTPSRAFNNGALTLPSVRVGSNGATARFAELTDRTAAEGLRRPAPTPPPPS